MSRQFALSLLFAMVLLEPYPASAAPITFNTALPVSEGEVLIAGQVVHRETEDVSGQAQTTSTLMSVLGYGLTPDFAVFGVVPYASGSLDDAMRERAAAGFGDLRVFARYTAYQNDFEGGTIRLAPFVGVKAPTGKSGKRDAHGVLPPTLQPGSGVWAAFGGLIGTWASTDYNFDAQIAYEANGGSSGVRPGSSFSADASVQYRVLPSTLDVEAPGWLYAVLEANFVHERKMRFESQADPNTGGSRLYLAPGLQYAAKRWIAEAAIQIPVTQDLNGPNRKDKFIVRAGLRLNF